MQAEQTEADALNFFTLQFKHHTNNMYFYPMHSVHNILQNSICYSKLIKNL